MNCCFFFFGIYMNTNNLIEVFIDTSRYFAYILTIVGPTPTTLTKSTTGLQLKLYKTRKRRTETSIST